MVLRWLIVAAILSLLFLKTWQHRAIGLSALAVVMTVTYLVYGMTSKPAATQLLDIVLKNINDTRLHIYLIFNHFFSNSSELRGLSI